MNLIVAFLYKHLTARLPQGESGYSAFFTCFKHLKENSTKENRCQHPFLLLCYFMICSLDQTCSTLR